MKNDAYLMLTIPIRPSLHILSKLICSLIWYIAAQVCKGIVTFIMIMSDKDNSIGFGYLLRSFTVGREDGGFDTENAAYILLSFLDTFMLVVMAQLFLYMVFVIASLSNKNSGMLSVLLAIGGSVLLSWGYGLVFAASIKMAENGYLTDFVFSAERYLPTLAYYTVLSVIFYIVTAYIMDHKYNLP